jgi:acetyl esterase/lipase
MADAARALQFVRSKAAEWNLDPLRVAGSGNSAGACSILWLALHDDLADRASADPVARESTRLLCAALDAAQTSLDPVQMREWTPNSRYGAHAFGLPIAKDFAKNEALFEDFVRRRDEVLPWIKQYSPIEQATPDDPPVYLSYDNKPALGQPQKDPTHSANFGVKLKERLDALGVPCELAYPGAPAHEHDNIESYLIAKLGAAPGPAQAGTAR